MSGSRIFTIDVDADLDESYSDNEEILNLCGEDDIDRDDAEVKKFKAKLSDIFADIDSKRSEFLEMLKEDYVAPSMPKETINADTVCNFIQADTSVEDFYHYVTRNGTEFEYCLNARESRGGHSALLVACEVANLALVAALLAAGVSPDQCLSSGVRPLDIAMQSNNNELIALLVRAGANKGFDMYATAVSESHHQLSKAVEANDVVAVSAILAAHQHAINLASIVIKLSHYCTRQAVMNGNLDLVKLLVEHGDDFIESDSIHGKSNIDVARDAGFDDIAAYLENKQREMYQKLYAQIPVAKPQATMGTVNNFFVATSPETSAAVADIASERPAL